jgi:hypothetical protein
MMEELIRRAEAWAGTYLSATEWLKAEKLARRNADLQAKLMESRTA